MSHDPPDRDRIYLDNAATSWPKPEAVYAVVDDYQRRLGAPAGRSGYAEAAEVSRRVEAARRSVATLVGLDDPAHLIFTANGTDSLNLVLHGLLRRAIMSSRRSWSTTRSCARWPICKRTRAWK